MAASKTATLTLRIEPEIKEALQRADELGHRSIANMSQGIENLADLIGDEGDGREFFSRNFVTHGIAQLFREGLLCLSGKSDQAVFGLTQAMGGGTTHMMIALGLLARDSGVASERPTLDLVCDCTA